MKKFVSLDRFLIGGFVIVFLVLGSSMAIYTDTFNAPDERMHHYVIRYITHQHTLPVLTGEKVTNEAHQPPLYYLFNIPLFALTKPLDQAIQVMLLRFFSLALSALVIPIVWFTVRNLFPDQLWLRITATGLLVLNPQFIFISSVINNDVLANVLGASLLASMALLINKVTLSKREFLYLAILLVAAFLTKPNLWPLIAIVVGILVVKKYQDINLSQKLMYIVPLGIVALSWLGRNLYVYGSITGLSYMKELWYTDQHKDFLSVSGLRDWIKTLFNSYWARFAYFNLALKPFWYKFFQYLTVLSGIGLLVHTLRSRLTISKQQLCIYAVWVASIALVGLQLFMFNLNFYQPQGRYLFVVSLPLCIFLALGLHALIPKRFTWIVTIICVGLLLTADIVSIDILRAKG